MAADKCFRVGFHHGRSAVGPGQERAQRHDGSLEVLRVLFPEIVITQTHGSEAGGLSAD